MPYHLATPLLPGRVLKTAAGAWRCRRNRLEVLMYTAHIPHTRRFLAGFFLA